MKNTTPTVSDLKPEHTERLRGAMRILVEYLLEKGHLTPRQQRTRKADTQEYTHLCLNPTIKDIDQV